MARCSDPIGIAELRDHLRSLDRFERDTVHRAVSRLETTSDALRRYIQYRDERYTRTLFHRDERFEILVIGWLPGQMSPIHDHANSICTMYTMQGLCETTTYRIETHGARRQLAPEQTLHLTPGSTTTVFGGDIHVVGCPRNATEPLITIHFYLPPIQEMLVFDPRTGESQVAHSETLDPLPETARL